MNILVDRKITDGKATGSEISVDGQFVCFGLEDEFRDVKVPGETRIPAGTYKVSLRVEGRHHEKYKVKFPGMHRGMLHVLDVLNFTWILIHIGNFETDTDGCLLTGTQLVATPPIRVLGSTAAYIKLYAMVVDAAERGELSITYVDNDGRLSTSNPVS